MRSIAKRFAGVAAVVSALVCSVPGAAFAGASGVPAQQFQAKPYSFEVMHIDKPGLFRARITAAPRITVEKDALYYNEDGTSTHTDIVGLDWEWSVGEGDNARHISGLTDKVLDHVKPVGLAVVGWEIDLMPLPGYPEQAVTQMTAVFDNGSVTTTRGFVHKLVAPIPDGAKRLVSVNVEWVWLDYDRTMVFQSSAAPGAGSSSFGIENGPVLWGIATALGGCFVAGATRGLKARRAA